MKFCLLYFLSYFLSDQFSSFKIRPKHYLSKQIPSSLSLKSFILKSTIYDEIVSDSSCVYDKDRVEDFYSSRPLLVLNRLIEVGTPVFEWWISKKIDSFLVKYRTVEENQYYVKQRASELRVAIVKGKSVTFIKSGQALALRPDIIKSVE